MVSTVLCVRLEIRRRIETTGSAKVRESHAAEDGGYSSGIPALRRPAKYVVSSTAWAFGSRAVTARRREILA